MAIPSLPRLPLWVQAVALALWVGLLVVAAWLGTLDTVATDVLADVVGSAATIAFAATGLAALLSVWQRRQLLRQMAVPVARQLNLAAKQVENLLTQLLTALQVVLPSVEKAGAKQLALLLRPPVDDFAPHLMDQIESGNRRLDREEQWAALVTSTAEQLADLPEPQAGEAHDLWLRKALMVAPVLSRWTLDRDNSLRIAQGLGPPLSQVARSLRELNTSVDKLAAYGLVDIAGLLEDTLTLTADFELQCQKFGPSLLGAPYREDPPGLVVWDTVGRIFAFLRLAIEISEDLTKMRSEFADRVQGRSTDTTTMQSAHWLVAREDKQVMDARLWFPAIANLMRAWDNALESANQPHQSE
jgi:heme exporter protein D